MDRSLIRATSIPLPRPFGSGNWGSLSVLRSGELLFPLCSHRPDQHVLLCRFDPRTESVEHILGLEELFDPYAVSQGKIHTPFIEHQGRVYFATHVGYYGSPPEGKKPYPGGHLVVWNPEDDQVSSLGIPKTGEGIISLAFNREHRAFFLMTWPRGYLIRYDLETGEFLDLGSQQTRPRPIADGSCRTLVSAGHDRLYYCRADGSIMELDVGTNRLRKLAGNMVSAVGRAVVGHGYRLNPYNRIYREMIVQARRKSWHGVGLYLPRFSIFGEILKHRLLPRFHNMWHAAFHDPSNGTILALNIFASMLLRIDPREERITCLGQMCPEQERGFIPRKPTPLNLCMSRDRTVYHLTARWIRPRGMPHLISRAHLVSFSLTHNRSRDHGEIRIEDGRHVLYANSLAIDKSNRLVAVAWVELNDANRVAEFMAGEPAPIEPIWLLPEMNPYELRLVFFEMPDES